jgi:hypothetical protein
MGTPDILSYKLAEGDWDDSSMTWLLALELLNSPFCDLLEGGTRYS